MEKSRRTLLRTVSSVGLLASTAGTVLGTTEDEHQIFEKGLKLVEDPDSVTELENYMANEGYKKESISGEVTGKYKTYEDGVSLEDIEKDTLSIYITLFSPSCDNPGNDYNSYYVFTGWWFEGSPICGHTPILAANDRIGLTYKEGAWYIPDGADGTWMADDVSTDPEDYGTNGIACRFNDRAVDDYCDSDFWYFAAPLKVADSGFEPGARQVWGVYSHLDEQKVGGTISLSFGGIGYSSWNDPEAWQRRTNDDGESLIVSEPGAKECQ